MMDRRNAIPAAAKVYAALHGSPSHSSMPSVIKITMERPSSRGRSSMRRCDERAMGVMPVGDRPWITALIVSGCPVLQRDRRPRIVAITKWIGRDTTMDEQGRFDAGIACEAIGQ